MAVYVQPLADQVREGATVWEAILADLGWNDLPKDLKYGIVLKMWDDGFLLVEWVAVSVTVMVAVDEIKLLTMEGNTQ